MAHGSQLDKVLWGRITCTVWIFPSRHPKMPTQMTGNYKGTKLKKAAAPQQIQLCPHAVGQVVGENTPTT